MNEELNLKPCPFCGNEKLKIESKSGTIHYYEKDGMNPWQRVVYSVRCNKCNARGGTVGANVPTMNYQQKSIECKNKAVEVWNRRT